MSEEIYLNCDRCLLNITGMTESFASEFSG